MKRRANLPEKGLNLKVEEVPGTGLSGRFFFPPFSVLRANDGAWQRRKQQWLALGIKSEIGRGEDAAYKSQESLTRIMKDKSKGLLHQGKTIDTQAGEKWEGGESAWQNTGTSIFDPVLCELMYLWFCLPGGQVVDPFAGGSVRGIVAQYMGLKYWGSELQEEQVAANIAQGQQITPDNPPTWICGNSALTLKDAPQADFIFSCPPYGNLEVYSDDDDDISNMNHDDFSTTYAKIIKRACRRLKDDRFACFVVANYRDKQGFYRNLVGDTVTAFQKGNAGFYNDAILITAIGSLPVRVGRQFSAGRKLGKTHQNILVFYKGDPKKIKANFPSMRGDE